MILKLLVFVITTIIIRSESVWTESTSKPSLPRDLQELLDSLYMTGYIPEYIIPEDELSETEKTEGEYLDFPELKNAQDDVFVPPESEYSKNHLHYKNIKARKRLVPDRSRKMKPPRLLREIQKPEISTEELRSDLLAPLVESSTGKEEKTNTSLKLDFLIPIPERGVYPSSSSSTDLHLSEGTGVNEVGGSTERSDSTELYNLIERISPIEQYNIRQTQHSSSKQPQWNSSRVTELDNLETNERHNSEPTRLHFIFSNSESPEGSNSGTIEISDSKSTQSVNSRPTEFCDVGSTEPMNNKGVNPQMTMTTPNPQGSMQFLNPQVPMNKSNTLESMEILNPQEPLITPNPLGFMNTSNSQGSMQIFNPQNPINIPNPLGSLQYLTLNPQGSMQSLTFNPQGSLKILIPQVLMNIPSQQPQGSTNIPDQPMRFINMPDHNGSTNWNNLNRECTQCTITKQYSFTIPELPSMPKYPELNTNTTLYQPLTFEIISPKTEKITETFQFTVAMQPQRNVTIKTALENQIKNMLNVQQWPKQLTQFLLNSKQPENGLRTPALDMKTEKQYAPCSVVPRMNRTIHASEEQTIRTGLDNSSRRADLKTIDKNIATNVVSLMADLSSINKIEAEGFKAVIKPSISVNREMTENVEAYFDRQSNNASDNIIALSQNAKNKETKNVSQHFITNSTGKENADGGRAKKKMFTFLNIFKKNKKYPTSNMPDQNNSTERKKETIEDSSNELYGQLLETNGMTDSINVECQFPMKQELEEEETFNHKRKKK